MNERIPFASLVMWSVLVGLVAVFALAFTAICFFGSYVMFLFLNHSLFVEPGSADTGELAYCLLFGPIGLLMGSYVLYKALHLVNKMIFLWKHPMNSLDYLFEA